MPREAALTRVDVTMHALVKQTDEVTARPSMASVKLLLAIALSLHNAMAEVTA